MEFPTREAIDQWYNSAAYAELRGLRIKSAISDIVLIDSLPEGFTVKGFASDIREKMNGA